MTLVAATNTPIILGGGRIVDECIGLIGRARTSLSGEFFTANDDPSRAALSAAWRDRGVPGTAVIAAHPQSIEQMDGIRGSRTNVVHYAGLAPNTAPREFIHTKLVAINQDSAPEAIVGSASLSPDSRWRFEAGAHVSGDAARAVHELADAQGSGDWQRMRDSIEWARSFGLYVTDPVTNSRGVSDMLEELVDTEPTAMTYATKSFFNATFAQQIADRHTAGLPIDVIVKRIDAPSERILRESGVRLLKPAADVPEIHGNVVVAHGLDQAYLGTLWPSYRSFQDDLRPNPYAGGGATLPRSQWWDRSREFGLLTADHQAVQDLTDGVQALLRPSEHDFRSEAITPHSSVAHLLSPEFAAE